jgi:hypothetical protein
VGAVKWVKWALVASIAIDIMSAGLFTVAWIAGIEPLAQPHWRRAGDSLFTALLAFLLLDSEWAR